VYHSCNAQMSGSDSTGQEAGKQGKKGGCSEKKFFYFLLFAFHKLKGTPISTAPPFPLGIPDHTNFGGTASTCRSWKSRAAKEGIELVPLEASQIPKNILPQYAERTPKSTPCYLGVNYVLANNKGKILVHPDESLAVAQHHYSTQYQGPRTTHINVSHLNFTLTSPDRTRIFERSSRGC
jgi:hypothetical protein